MTGEHSVTTFEIAPEYLTSVTIHRKWGLYDHLETLTPEQLLIVLAGKDRCSSTHSEDHPEFAKLRNQLEAGGFIQTSRNSWNGDYALKSFILNGVRFDKGDRFKSGCAIKWDLDHSEKRVKQ
jgi:hypothetical protein